MNRRAWLTWGVLLAAALTASSCETNETLPEECVTVLAAASTSDALREVADQFRREYGVDVHISSGPSNGLARQILEGAPADVFVAASTDWANVVVEKGLAVDHRSMLSNSLVLIVPPGNPAHVLKPADLLAPNVRHVALAGINVPAGVYAEAALRSAGHFEQLEDSNRIVRGHDVRHTLNYVARSEADAGVVYATDARISPHVAAVYEFPAATSEEIAYPFVLLKSAADRQPARQFWEYLQSRAALDVFHRHGFKVLESKAPATATVADHCEPPAPPTNAHASPVTP